jgi:hypothetical protein
LYFDGVNAWVVFTDKVELISADDKFDPQTHGRTGTKVVTEDRAGLVF